MTCDGNGGGTAIVSNHSGVSFDVALEGSLCRGAAVSKHTGLSSHPLIMLVPAVWWAAHTRLCKSGSTPTR